MPFEHGFFHFGFWNAKLGTHPKGGSPKDNCGTADVRCEIVDLTLCPELAPYALGLLAPEI